MPTVKSSSRYNRDYVTAKCREVLDELRGEIREASLSRRTKEEAVIKRLEAHIRAERARSCSGGQRHRYNPPHQLGRALLPQAAIDAMTAVAGSQLTWSTIWRPANAVGVKK